jgi:hypothetical protein
MQRPTLPTPCLPWRPAAVRLEADNLGAPFNLGALLVMQVLEPAARVSIGTLYVLDDGSDVAMCGHRASRPTFG